MLWRAKFYQALPVLMEKHPSARWVSMVLTVRNCEILDLRETIQAMNKAWKRFILRPEFANATIGWVRTTEVTHGIKDTAHPHFHVLMLVHSSYYGGKFYIKRERWIELWRECAKLDYDPQLWVEDPQSKKRKQQFMEKGEDISSDNVPKKAILEALKYSVKPADMFKNPEWFKELTRQVHKLRFIASGGEFKEIFKPEPSITNEDMIHLGDSDKEDLAEELMRFLWSSTQRRYIQHQNILPVDKEMVEAVKKHEQRERFRRRIKEL